MNPTTLRDLAKNLLTARFTQLLTPLLVAAAAWFGASRLAAGSAAGTLAGAAAVAVVLAGEYAGKWLLHKLLDELQAHGVPLDNPVVKEVLADLQAQGLAVIKQALAKAGPAAVLLALLLLPGLAGGCAVAQGLAASVGTLLTPPAPPAGQSAPTPQQQVTQAHQLYDGLVFGVTIARVAGQISDAEYPAVEADLEDGKAALDVLDAKAAALAAGQQLSLGDYLAAFNAAAVKIQAHQTKAAGKPATRPAAAVIPAAPPVPAAEGVPSATEGLPPAAQPAGPPDVALSGDAGDVAPPGPIDLK
jgi:hypothetical protein